MKLPAKLFTASFVSMLLSFGLCGMFGGFPANDVAVSVGLYLFGLSLFLLFIAFISWIAAISKK